MKKYSVKRNEDFYIGHFDNGNKKKKDKNLLEWHLHVESAKLFMNIKITGESGLRKAVMDNVQIYFYPDENGEIFVNADWIIDKNILGNRDTLKLQELKEKILTNNESLIKGKKMDKQIKKVKKDVEKNDKKKAEKDIHKLQKMDKKFDEEIDECKDMKKKKKR